MKAFIALVCLMTVAVSQTFSQSTNPPPPANPIQPPVDCDISTSSGEEAVILPNPAACESYYVCDAGNPILMTCPEGLQFNSELLVCDWPNNVNCTIGMDYAALF